MDGVLSVLSYGVGTVVGLIVIIGLLVLVIHDVTQKKHTVLRNFPVIGRLRFSVVILTVRAASEEELRRGVSLP